MELQNYRMYLMDQKGEGDPVKTLFSDLPDLAMRRQADRPVGIRPLACLTGTRVILNADELSEQQADFFNARLSSIEEATLLAWELVCARCYRRGLFSDPIQADEAEFYQDVAGVSLADLAGEAADRVRLMLPARLSYCLAKQRNTTEGVILAKGLGALYLGVFTGPLAPFTTNRSVGSFYPCFDIRDIQDEYPDPLRTRILLARES